MPETDNPTPNNQDAPLPFTFDLLYDIKALGELHNHLTGKRRTTTSATDAELLELMREHNIALPVGYEVDSTSLPARYEQALALLQMLNEHARPADDARCLVSSYIEAQTRELLQHHGRFKP